MLALTLGASDIQCLTDTVFHEARDQPIDGMYLVYRTVLNRQEDSRWPDTVCGVTNQHKQFSYTLEPKEVLKAKVKKEQDVYNGVYNAVNTWLNGHPDSLFDNYQQDFEGVNHYLRCDIIHKTKWTSKMTFLGREGDHCFYKG